VNPRDERQARVYQWVTETFGLPNANVHERVLRLFEEVTELAQAELIGPDELNAIVAHVFSKPTGAPEQELGGVGTTLLAYAASKGLSADALEQAELDRVLAIDPEHFRKRHNMKADAGIAVRAPDDRCPKCGGELTFGFGMAFGGDQSGYEMCLDCDWYEKPGVTPPGETTCFPYGIRK
jgi:hypothetical protein